VILDIFSELQTALPAAEVDSRALYAELIEQAREADRQGFGCWWAVEHHTSPEFSFSSAPEMILAVLAQHTQRIHLGSAGILSPFEINHPVRVAERTALVDVLSDGRLELGLARSGGAEWETFGVDPDTTRLQLEEALRMIPKIWAGEGFRWQSELLTVPQRDFVPRPLQRPHPPLWQTVSGPESCHMAGRLGVGMLGSCALTPLEHVERTLADYEAGLAECEPAGAFVNDQRAVFTLVHCAESREQAIASRAGEAALWFMNTAPEVFRVPRDSWVDLLRGAVGKGAASGPLLDAPEPLPTQEELDDPVPVIALMNRQRVGQALDPVEVFEALEPLDTAIIGDVETCLAKLEKFAALGVDRLMCLMQFGALPHERVMDSIRLAGKHLVPSLEGLGRTSGQ
jgi:alkanesulfonate monooxygenase SsuD/methylene tetrahydromethanopterin reductase-like flavin-dependent oxidoreductase (luciferase family)